MDAGPTNPRPATKQNKELYRGSSYVPGGGWEIIKIHHEATKGTKKSN
jgi:hypothetical protein